MSEPTTPTPEALSNARTWLVQPQDGSRDDRETPRLAWLFDRFAAAAVQRERERERCREIAEQYSDRHNIITAIAMGDIPPLRSGEQPTLDAAAEQAREIADRLVHDRCRINDDTPAYDITGSDSAFIERASLEIAAALRAAEAGAIERAAVRAETTLYGDKFDSGDAFGLARLAAASDIRSLASPSAMAERTGTEDKLPLLSRALDDEYMPRDAPQSQTNPLTYRPTIPHNEP